MKKTLLLVSLIIVARVYGMEENNSISQSSSTQKIITLCNDDTCIQATITPYDANRDQHDVQRLFDQEQFKLPHMTPEFLVPYFSQKIEALDQSSPTGLAISGDLIYCSQVLRDKEKALGFIAYLINALKEPSPTVTGNIVLLSVAPTYQVASEEQLLKAALWYMSSKKVIVASSMMHEDNTTQRSTVEKLGFIDNSQQIKTMKDRIKKSMTSEQNAAATTGENQHLCYYMKMLEENVTEEMKNPKPIESSLPNITHANFEQQVANAGTPVVIDVYTNWCVPCRKFAPIFEEVAIAHTAYKFVRFNCVEEEQELAKKLGVEAFPTILFVKDGEVIGKEMGFMSKEILQQKLVGNFNS